jgi:hypothetical protein
MKDELEILKKIVNEIDARFGLQMKNTVDHFNGRLSTLRNIVENHKVLLKQIQNGVLVAINNVI